MAQYTFIVLSNPTTPAQEEEYNDWYNRVHLADVLNVPGIVAAQRFRLADKQFDENPSHKYLAKYELETDNLEALLADLASRMHTPDMIISDAFDLPNVGGYIFSPLGERVLAADVQRPRRTA
jgi:hypothetical protein